ARDLPRLRRRRGAPLAGGDRPGRDAGGDRRDVGGGRSAEEAVITIYWITAVASLLAVWLNIRHCGACFWIWSVTNAIWMYADVVHGLMPQAIVQGIYLALSFYGITAWRNREEAPS